MLNLSSLFALLRRDRRGASVVEFAILAPVVVMMTVAASDFARVFIEAHAIASASNSGVVFGARRNIDSVNFTEMKARALEDIQGASGATADAEMFCDCPSNPNVLVNCLDGSCPNYGKPRVYVKTSVTKNFKTLAKYPWVPNSMSMTAKGYMRVQ